MSREALNNSFAKGLNTDFNEYQTPTDVYTYAENVTFISNAGNEMILQNEKGTTLKANLKENYIPLAVKDYNGILYIISGEVIDNVFTGRGEIGSYPSPDYQNYTLSSCIGASSPDTCTREGLMTFDYRPFHNFKGGDNLVGEYGEFNSELFNFTKENTIEIVAIQQSYDNTVNIIFTDNFNKPKIVNSRFTVLPDNKYKIINRTGDVDENQYEPSDFESKLNQFVVSNKLPVINFEGQGEGKLPSGTYIYYFRYITRDNNLTDVIGQSFSIPVYFGTTVRTTRGGTINENTTKSNRIKISNLDSKYYGLKLYFSYIAGSNIQNDQVVYEITREYLIDNNTELVINHTGFEVSNPIPQAELSLVRSDIFTYKTGTELQGRLFVGNIKRAGFDFNQLRGFASKIKTFTAEKRIGVKGSAFTVSTSDLDIPITKTRALDGWDFGYYNPANVHDYLGYWAGEPYLFSIEFKFKNGTSSPLFPVRGIDNAINNSLFPTNYTDNELLNDKDFDETNKFENTRGLYRFTRREGLNPLLENQSLSILHPEFEIPDLPDYIKENTIGFRIHRAKFRKKTCLAQGIVINTMIVPENDYLEENLVRDNNGGELTNYNNIDSNKGYSEQVSKFIPAPEFILESAGVYQAEDNITATELIRLDDVLINGVEAVKFMQRGYNVDPFGRVFEDNAKIPQLLNKRYAFISPEIIGDKVQSTQILSGVDKSMTVFANGQFVYAETQPNKLGSQGMTRFQDIESGNENDDFVRNPSYFTLYKELLTSPTAGVPIRCDLEFIEKDSAVPSINRFSGKAYFQSWNKIVFSGQNRPQSTGYGLHPLAYEDYVGVYAKDLTTSLASNFEYANARYVTDIWQGNSGFFVASDSANPNNQYEMLGNPSEPKRTLLTTGNIVASHVNIYNGSGPPVFQTLLDIHFPEAEAFTPITQWTYWSTETALESGANLNQANILIDNRIAGFNGDNYTSIVHRKLYKNSLEPLIADGNISRNIRIGHTISFASESNVNIAFRGEEIFDVNEGVRTFAPYNTKPTPELKDLDWQGFIQPWRKYNLFETEFLNSGYNTSNSNNTFIVIDVTNPFVQTEFNTRIHYSELFVNKAFDNGYRNFVGLNYRDYSAHLGDLTALRSLQGAALIAVYENGVTMIPVDQRIGGLNDLAGEVFFRSAGVLPPPNAVKYIDELYGSKWQHSVITHPNYIYGVDIDKAKIWRTSGDRIELLSDFQVQKYTRLISSLYYDQKEEYNGHQIRTHYDKFKQNIIFSFIRPDKSLLLPDYAIDDRFATNLVYNEVPYNQWLTFLNYTPEHLMCIRDIPFTVSRNGIWQHYDNQKYNIIYDEDRKFVFEVVVSGNAFYHFMYDNLVLITNHIYPEKIEYTTDAGTFIQTLKPRNNIGLGSEPYKEQPLNNIFTYDVVYKEDKLYITIMKDEDDTRKLSNFINRRIRDKYCKIRFTYNTIDQLYIKQLITYVTKSFS